MAPTTSSKLLGSLALLAATVAVATPPLAQPAAGERPHIVLLIADDFGWANAGWHRPEGDEEVRTPYLDTLVRQGIELDRAYQFKFCSPSRSSLQSGRLPVHVNTENLGSWDFNPDDPVGGFAGIPRSMTGMAEHLKRAGYATHQVGKWDAGGATPEQTPLGRGYDTSLGYFNHANDYWTEHVGLFVDLWDTDKPAWGQNGSAPPRDHTPLGTWTEEDYEEYKFKTRVLQVIERHDTSVPLFLCYCFHIVHEPMEVPEKIYEKFSNIKNDFYAEGKPHRRTYAAMVSYMDTAAGDIVTALEKKGIWDSTLLVFQTDNGGPSFSGSQHTANNYPLKGSKMSNWEGGIRGNAFVSGGFLHRKAPQRIGKKLEGYTHICDWYATFAALAGVDPTDEKATEAGLPPIDSLNLWPYLSGDVEKSPREEIFADVDTLIVGDWKLIGANQEDATGGSGTSVMVACWHGPRYPNGTSHPNCKRKENCSANGGCLYNIKDDPNEHQDVATENVDKLHELQARLSILQKTIYKPKRTGGPMTLAVHYALTEYRGFWGPYIFPNSSVTPAHPALPPQELVV